MIQDDQVSMPNRRTTTADNAERVHTELMSQVQARQTSFEQQQAAISTNISTRRESMYYFILLEQSKKLHLTSVCHALAESVKLEDQPLAEDQQALLAEFERRRRVRRIREKKS